jgi:hypothetical protein
MHNKKAQVWMETVIYTLIAFGLIAAVLSFVKPKIDEIQDKAIIDQSIMLVKEIDSTIREIVQGGAGNKRKLEISIKDGSLVIDGATDSLNFELDSSYVYSEIGKEIAEGNLIIVTSEKGNTNLVIIGRNYTRDNYNIKFNGEDTSKTLNKAATSYNLFISNNGKDASNKWNINIELG